MRKKTVIKFFISSDHTHIAFRGHAWERDATEITQDHLAVCSFVSGLVMLLARYVERYIEDGRVKEYEGETKRDGESFFVLKLTRATPEESRLFMAVSETVGEIIVKYPSMITYAYIPTEVAL
jgi:hypothetical protein